MKYCQGPDCHTYHTQDRIRGTKGNKHYQTRRRSSFYYLGGNACSMTCERDWFDKFGNMAVDHFGRTTEAKRTDASGAWYKTRDWRGDSNDRYFFANDLLGERIPITEQQYSDDNFTIPN